MYIPRERSFPLFSGTGEIEEEKSLMRMHRSSAVDQAYFICHHLIGEACEEIKNQTQGVRDDPNLIF